MKSFINKIVDAPKLIKRIWILLWIILVILLVMKFCFGIWYPIVVKNETFIKVCDFIDNHKWLNITISGVFYFLSGNLICLTFMNKKKYDNIIMALMFNVCIISVFILKNFYSTIGSIFEILYCLVFVIIINIKQNNFGRTLLNIIIPIILYIILNLWQFTILIVRGVEGLDLSKLPSLIYITMMLDYYIFLIITYMGVCTMGILSIGWFFSRDITVLKAEKEKELSKKNPDISKIAKIDARIESLEKEGK